MHLVPGRMGDSNSVSVAVETRDLPEELPTATQDYSPYFFTMP
jgi:hypothetical protein